MTSEKNDSSRSPVSTGEGRRKKSRLLTADRRKKLETAAYVAVLLFYILYFFRPGELIPGLDAVPLTKIPGVFVVFALIAQIVSGNFRWIPEIKLFLLLYAYLCLCIPTSVWYGGSFFLLVTGFSKFVSVIVVTMGAVTTVGRLRTVMLVQTGGMLTLALLARTQGGRLYGPGANFSDPNELALNLCIVLPFCVALLLFSREKMWKLFWAVPSVFFILSIVATFSRGGFLALIAVLLTMWWQFAIRPRTAILFLLIGCLIAGFAIRKTSYLERISTITTPDAEASAQQRQQLLIRSLELTIQHPVFGVGPGAFQQLSGAWHETHNTYTQFSAEAGIPALIIFLTIMMRAFKDLRLARNSGRRNQVWYLAGAVNCALAGYLVGAFFLSTAYALVPYLLVAYSAVLRIIARDSDTRSARQRRRGSSDQPEPSKEDVSTTVFEWES